MGGYPYARGCSLVLWGLNPCGGMLLQGRSVRDKRETQYSLACLVVYHELPKKARGVWLLGVDTRDRWVKCHFALPSNPDILSTCLKNSRKFVPLRAFMKETVVRFPCKADQHTYLVYCEQLSYDRKNVQTKKDRP